jgi:hypothetical protein
MVDNQQAAAGLGKRSFRRDLPRPARTSPGREILPDVQPGDGAADDHPLERGGDEAAEVIKAIAQGRAYTTSRSKLATSRSASAMMDEITFSTVSTLLIRPCA